VAKAGAGTGSDNDNRDTEIVTVLIRISKKTRTILGLRLAEIGLATGEDDLLLALDSEHAVTVEQLSEKLSVRLPTIRKSVERLAARGLVNCVTFSTLRLTAEGAGMQPRVMAVHRKIAHDIARAIDIDRLRAITAELNDLDAGLGLSLTKVT
jgi:Mn-dependent DtxR family transcriptional regulator